MVDSLDTRLIDGTTRKLAELFTSRKYALDYYQREYTWTETNVTELLGDLVAAFQRDFDPADPRTKIASYRPYFLGPLVTSASEGKRFIVDGQQRLTSLTLLLVYLIHLLEEIDGAQNLTAYVYSEKFGQTSFNIDVDEREAVMNAILEGKPFDTITATESVRNIWDRYQDICELFPDELKDPSTILHFVDWLLERVTLVEIGTTDQNMALEIFETMNDRGLRLSNTDMLKGFLLARIAEPQAIESANEMWRKRVTALSDIEKNADAEFIKAWLRGKFAETIRQGTKDAVPRDFELIATAFHKWVRENTDTIGLHNADDFKRLVNNDFNKMSHRYGKLLEASATQTPGFEPLFYNSVNKVSMQFLPMMAAITPDDNDETFQAKARVIASYLDLFVTRRMINFRNFGYSTIRYTIFSLAKDLRDKNLDEVHAILANRVADLTDTFEAIDTYWLTQRNRTHIHYILARMTAWLEEQCNTGPGFESYVNRQKRDPFEVEHIWANHPERHTDDFRVANDFNNYRNHIGGLILLPKSFNASYGDKTYADKHKHYFAQNLLARTLHPTTYENNPTFLKLMAATSLPFKAYPDQFTKEDLDERQDLYRQICNVVWNPDTLGIGGGTPSQETTDQERRVFYGVTLSNLVDAGIVAPGAPLKGTRSGKTHTAKIVENGRIQTTDSKLHDTLSGAGDHVTSHSVNGWDFWSIQRDNDWIALTVLRNEWIASTQTTPSN
jgi:uncharacterized protein with ParB-like and HNH nuclease domain